MNFEERDKNVIGNETRICFHKIFKGNGVGCVESCAEQEEGNDQRAKVFRSVCVSANMNEKESKILERKAIFNLIAWKWTSFETGRMSGRVRGRKCKKCKYCFFSVCIYNYMHEICIF